jgi:selenide,water dikinase
MTPRLTQTVQKGGCAAKISADVLRDALGKLDLSSTDPAVLIDARTLDDAGIYQIGKDIALVQTLDFFTPIVDTPSLFGRIASVNALSDVYAMGGEPKTAMAILAFPLATLDTEVLQQIMTGSAEVLREAGCSLIGGHSIDDDTLKFGLSVTGTVHPGSIWSNASARAGDRLILTKPLGTGTLCAGLKNGDYAEQDLVEAIASMSTLNRVRDLLQDRELAAIHAATDITGFGLLGHCLQLARASGVTLRLQLTEVPLFELTLSSLRAENLTKAHRTNRTYVENETRIAGSPSKESLLSLVDPQTSGGLLLSVSPDHCESILTRLRERFPACRIIGDATAPESSRVVVQA